MKEHLNWIKQLLKMDDTESTGEENADVLLRMAEDGDDLTKPRDIDFHHLFSSAAEAMAFCKALNGHGYSEVDHDYWPERNVWLTAVHVKMVPALDEITATENALNEIAASFNGEPDGWGCMEVI